jgi:hypothetical protein
MAEYREKEIKINLVGGEMIGEIKRGRDIGKKRLSNQYIYAQCPYCKIERWVDLFIYNKSKTKPSIVCPECNSRRQGKISSKKWNNFNKSKLTQTNNK